MKRPVLTIKLASFMLALGFPGIALAHPEPASNTAKLETCLAAASKIRAGAFVKVEYLSPSAEGMPSFEIEVRDADGSEWEFMCDAAAGHIYEVETEVDSSSDEPFKSRAEVSEQQARRAALDLYPGAVQEVEYEIESNGDATYEFDIVDKSGVEWKVEVSAASGKVIEVHVEQWEIGEEPGERGR